MLLSILNIQADEAEAGVGKITRQSGEIEPTGGWKQLLPVSASRWLLSNFCSIRLVDFTDCIGCAESKLPAVNQMRE